jgi:hypothetical protein
MQLLEGREWADEPEMNLCDPCAQKKLSEAWSKISALMEVVTTDHESKETFIARVRSILGPNV